MTAPTPDLFSPPQGDLFAADTGPNPGIGRARPDAVRARLLALLAQARAARDISPWTERDTRMYQIVFPQMANWLPESEAEQLRLEFANELSRLQALS